VAYKGAKIQREKPKTGSEAMIGDKAVAYTDINKECGKVMYHGELWFAYSDEEIKKDETVIIEKVEGLKLKVRKAKPNDELSCGI
jgi:membrane-bound serine protease (ClpP class)